MNNWNAINLNSVTRKSMLENWENSKLSCFLIWLQFSDSLKAAPGDYQHSSEMKPSRKSSSWLHVTPVRAHGDSTHEHHPLRDQLHRLHHHHPHQDHELSSEFKSSKNSFHWLHITPVRTTPNSKLSKNDDYQNKINWLYLL